MLSTTTSFRLILLSIFSEQGQYNYSLFEFFSCCIRLMSVVLSVSSEYLYLLYSNFHKCEVAIRLPKSCPIRIRRTSFVRKPLYIFKRKKQSCHLDSSSLSVEGDYKLSVKREDQEESIIHITRGYSKDKRPD